MTTKRTKGYNSRFAKAGVSCNLTRQCFEFGNKNIPPKR